jgi:hypothetical protein
LSFTVKRAADGSRGLWSLDHAELSVPLGPPSFARTQAVGFLRDFLGISWGFLGISPTQVT